MDALWLLLGALALALASYGLGYYQGRVGTILAKPDQGQGRVAFTVVSPDGDYFYEGNSGGDARRIIESLRLRGQGWEAYRDGQPWCCSTFSISGGG